MAKRELPIQEFQDVLNMYVANWWFPWKHKIIKNEQLDKLVVVASDSHIVFHAHGEQVDDVITHSYSVAELFSVESCLHDFVTWKTSGLSWHLDGQSAEYDVWYGFQYMTMATMNIWQKMDYFMKTIDIT